MERARRGRDPLPMTDEQREIIMTMNIRQAARHLKIDRRRVRRFREELGLDKPKSGRPQWEPSEAEIELMMQYSLEDLEVMLNVSVRTLRAAMNRLELKKR